MLNLKRKPIVTILSGGCKCPDNTSPNVVITYTHIGTCTECDCSKCCEVKTLKLEYLANHCCEAAIYDLLIKESTGAFVNVGQINLNGCGLVSVTKTVTDTQMLNIVTPTGCCNITIKLRCALGPGQDGGWGPGTCHPNLSTLVATLIDNNNNQTVIFQGGVGEEEVSLNAC